MTYAKSEATAGDLDAIDRRLLDVLQCDASLTNQALAERVHISPATCLRRVRRLRETGVIEREVALLDPARAGVGLMVLCEVTLDRQGAEHLDAFETRAVAHPAVQQCYRVSPGPDFVLGMAVRDMEAWAATSRALFTQDANVRNVKALFVVSRAKFAPSFAMTAEDDAARPSGG